MSKEVKSGQEVVVVEKKPFALVDMAVSKKEMLNNMIEIQQVTMQEAMEQSQEELNELSDFSDLMTKATVAKIQKEVQAHPVVKATFANKEKLNKLCHEVRSEKASCSVDASYRMDDVNVAVRLSDKGITLHFGTSDTRFQQGTIDLKKVSATAKKLHGELEKRSKAIEAKAEVIKKQHTSISNFSRDAVRVKHDFNKVILNQTPEGKKVLAELEAFEKKFKKGK